MATDWKNRGVSADDALRCCETQRLSLELDIRTFIGTLLNEMLQLRSHDDFDSVLAFIPGVPVRPHRIPVPWRIGRFVKGAPLVVGAIVLLSAWAMESLIGQLAALETLQGILDGLDGVIPQSECRSCISRKIWRQNRPQKKVTQKLRRRQ